MVGIMIYCMYDFYSVCLKEDSWDFLLDLLMVLEMMWVLLV